MASARNRFPNTPPSLERTGFAPALSLALAVGFLAASASAQPRELLAGAARIEITHPDHPAGDNPPFVRALVLSDPGAGVDLALVAVDAVAVAEIGSIRDPYLARVRERVSGSTGIEPHAVVVNASHCHARVRDDVEDLTVEAVRLAWDRREPVVLAAGSAEERGVSVNRRFRLRDGSEADERHAYALPPSDEIEGSGPIDPAVGLLRLDRVGTGETLALLFHFACHPIQGVPGGGNTADLSGYAAGFLEAALGGDAVALFFQGCGGDINPVGYKAVDQPRDARVHGTRLGATALAAARGLETAPLSSPLRFERRSLSLPRAELGPRIAEMEEEIERLADSLRGTFLNFETFLPLYVKHHLSGRHSAADATRRLRDEALSETDWDHFDEQNHRHLEAYVRNLLVMEEITRKQINLRLLEKHRDRNEAAAAPEVEAEVAALRAGEFHLVTFPAELTAEVGLAIKDASPHPLTFVSGYTDGYLYYAPTEAQLLNRGGAQEDSDCLFGTGWQAVFEAAALEMLAAP